MFITKRSIPRRRFLQGVGAAVALPFLDSMIPAATALAQTAARPVRRFGAVFVPMGEQANWWTPETTGADFEFKPIMKSLEPCRKSVVVVTGLDTQVGGHSASACAFLTSVVPKRTEAEDFRAGISLDQIIAKQIGQDTTFSSIELAIETAEGYIGACDTGFSCAYQNTLSWRGPTTPVPMETNPRMLFERLFGRPGTVAQRTLRRRQDGSILDSVKDDVNELQLGLGPRDLARLSDYLENIREIEVRIQRAERQSAASLTVPTAPIGIPDDYAEHAGLLFDLLAVAYEGDITRVGTVMMAREVSQKIYPEIGVTEPHHHISHHRGVPEARAKLVTVQTYQFQQFANFVAKLQATPDGDGSLLDHSLILFGSGMSESDSHSPTDLPVVLAGGLGGQVKGNRHIKLAAKTPRANLLVDIANKFGVEIDRFGPSTGRVEL